MVENNWNNATFTFTDKVIFENITWKISLNENITITGPVGSGKSLLLQCLARTTRLSKGQFSTIIDGKKVDFSDFNNKVKTVYFSESNRFFRARDFFYQQRYQASIASSGSTVKDYLHHLSVPSSSTLIKKWISFSGIDKMLSLHLIQLSSGQRRKLMLTKALMESPRWILLDDPYNGMDQESRMKWNEILIRWCEQENIQWVITGRKEDLTIQNATQIEVGKFPYLMAQDKEKESSTVLPPNSFYLRSSQSNSVFELNNVQIQYGSNILMHQLNAVMYRGDKICLQGKNGTGKSTLLSLLFGDNPLAYRESIFLFGKRRGSGETIWDIKKKIGYVSPESHLYFPKTLTVIDVIAAGFEDKISPSQVLSRNQKSNINTWLSSVGLRKKANEPLSRLSTGEQKIVLWIRALVKSPELLLLDEPYQGLDLNTIRKLNALLDEWIHPQQSLLFITHYNYEMPNCIQKIWKMEGQKINQQIL